MTPLHARRVIVAIPVLLVGGTEIHTLALVDVLVRAGCHVTVCCYYDHDAAIVARLERSGAQVILMNGRRADGLAKLFAGLVRTFRDLKPDVVHVQYVAPALVPIVAARVARVRRVLATLHTAGKAAYGRRARAFVRVAARLCDAFICVSHGVEEFWFGASRAADGVRRAVRHHTIHNGVPVHEIRSAAREGGREQRVRLAAASRRTVGVVGRLTREKGLWVLLDAMRVVVDALPQAMLVVVGAGRDEALLRHRADELGLAEHVAWAGRRNPEAVFRLYGAMDVVAVPSLFEGFGLVAAEAMAAGVPVVASDVEGMREVVEHGATGLLVPPGDAGALARGILSVLSDPGRARAMGEAGRDRVAASFSHERFRDGVLAAYQAVVS